MTPQLLTTQYNRELEYYMVIPVLRNKEDPDREFLFFTEYDAAQFVKYYFENPLAAVFAYNVSMGYESVEEQEISNGLIY